jgi:hypothetical protein
MRLVKSPKPTSPHVIEAAKVLKFFVLGHSPQCFSGIPFLPYLEKFDLTSLPQPNSWAESRIFFTEVHESAPEYIGFGSWRWDIKFWWVYRLQYLYRVVPFLDKKLVFTPLYGRPDWDDLESLHKCFWWFSLDILVEIRDYVCVLMGENNYKKREPRVLCSSFICHKSVYLKFIDVYRSAVEHFYHKYGEEIPFLAGKGIDERRIPGYMFELLTMWYFAHCKEVEVRTLGN